MAVQGDEDSLRVEEDSFRVEEEVQDIDLTKLSSEIKERLNISKVDSILHCGKSLDILICGKTGCGKSSLVNGLIGVKLMESASAKEGSDEVDPCTSEVVKYATSKEKINITIWDTPGLIDGTGNLEKYLQDIANKCPSVHLKLFCINSGVTRFVDGEDNQDFKAMEKFTDAFGFEFWENVIIVLTMANIIEQCRPAWKMLPPKEKRDKFIKVIDQIKKKTRFRLKEFGVPEETVDKIKMVPAGYHTEPKLLDRDYWLSDLYFECLDAIPSPDARGTLLKLNLSRLKTREDVSESDFDSWIELQPLILPPGSSDKSQAYTFITEGPPQNPPVSGPNQSETSTDSEKKTTDSGIGEGGAAGIGGGVGGVVGAGLGFIGLIGGPLAFVTVPAGAAAGSALGAGLGYLTKRLTRGSSTSSSSTPPPSSTNADKESSDKSK